jgi:phage recombination protein Bet
MSTAMTEPVYDTEKIALVKRLVCRGASDDELALFLHVCRRTGLDPLARQIYALKRRENVDGEWVERLSIQTGIDGYRLVADRTGHYAPGREPSFAYDAQGRLVSATAHVRKQTADGTWHEVSATAHYAEYAALKRDGQPTRMWADKPHVMLQKCAEALALRRAFPAELSGVHTADEMESGAPPRRVEGVKQIQDIDPDSEVINDQQLAFLRQLLSDSGADLPKFLASYAIEAPEDLPLCHWQDARTKLEAKIMYRRRHEAAAQPGVEAPAPVQPPAAAPAATPEATPPAPAPTPVAIPDAEHLQLLRQLHREIEKNEDLTWVAALRFAGVIAPGGWQGWEEPESEADAEHLADVLSKEQVQRLLMVHAPKGKKAPGKTVVGTA